MKFNTKRILIVCLIVLSMLVVGCARSPVPDKQTPNGETGDETTPGTTGDQDTPDEDGTEEGIDPEIAALMKLFPENEGYRWVYDGFAEYGHEMTLDEIAVSDDQVIYNISGEVFDASDGEADRDFSLTMLYSIAPGVVYQDKMEEAMMDSIFDHIELIRGPLEQGTTWTQTVLDSDNNEVTILSTITEIEQDGNAMVYKVDYEDQGSAYYEKRIIKEGFGVIYFERLYITEDDSFTLTYSLYEEASGYTQQD